MRPEVVGQLQKYDIGFNGTFGQGGTQQAIARYSLFDSAPGHHATDLNAKEIDDDSPLVPSGNPSIATQLHPHICTDVLFYRSLWN
jgi:hypothetical protein